MPPQFEVVRDPQRCVNCKVCVSNVPTAFTALTRPMAGCWRMRANA